MGSLLINTLNKNKYQQIMAFRIFSDVSNIPSALEGKRVTRASRKVLAEVPIKNVPLAAKGCYGKENVVDNLQKGQKKVIRQCKVAARRINNVMEEQESPMEVESIVEACRIPEGVKDIDAEDSSNPQLCTEYALEIYAYLKQLEKRRSVLIDWLVEVQIQFKLLQETLFLTVDTIDRFL